MFKTVASIVKSGKRVGFVVVDEKNKKYKLTDDKIKEMMSDGYIFDITYDGRGFRFKERGKKIYRLNQVELRSKNSVRKNVGNKLKVISTDEFTSHELKEYIDNSNVTKLKHRNFVRGILEYVNLKDNRALAITGLRGTGKTTGILQAIHEIGDFDRTVFININEDSNMECLDLKQLILSKYGDKKYIFIDEITRVRDIINNSAFLADRLTMSGKKVIVSGTDSLSLIYTKNASLYHRVIDINVTHITYGEAVRTSCQSLKHYIEMGGLYKNQAITDIDGLRDYIDTAVIDNIMNTIMRNKGTTTLLNVEKLGRNKIRTIVFRVIYAIIYLSTTKIKPVNIESIVNLYDYTGLSIYDAEKLSDLVFEQIGVSNDIETNASEVKCILDVLERLGMLVKIPNIIRKSQYNYYITNPSIINQVLKSMVDILDGTNINKYEYSSIKSKQGLIFESMVVKHTVDAANKLGCHVYFYHDKQGKEIDLIVEREIEGVFDNVYLYYEVKMTDNSDIATINTKWLNDTGIESKIGGTTVQKSIIYRGESRKFSGFEDRSVYSASKNMSLTDIENLNMGVSLINAEEYMLNAVEHLQILRNYRLDNC